MRNVSILAVCVCALVGCEKDAPKDKPATRAEKPAVAADKAPGTKAPEAPASDHGNETALGQASVAGYTFEVAALGALKAGSDAAIALKVIKTPAGRDWRATNAYLWVEDAAGKKLSAPEKGREENGRLHAHASIPASVSEAPAKVVVRIREGDTDERTSLPLSAAAGAGAKAPAHTHEKTPHDGLVAKLLKADGTEAGWIELKLHDDKGDLELWTSLDKAASKPLDLAPDTTITVTFVDHARRTVKLAPRNKGQNEDEDGKPNMRDGKTGYFIYPGDTGADAAWLVGKTFQSVVFVELAALGQPLRSEEFVLKPHAHAAGVAH